MNRALIVYFLQAVTITLQQDTANNWQTVQLITDKSFLASDRVVH